MNCDTFIFVSSTISAAESNERVRHCLALKVEQMLLLFVLISNYLLSICRIVVNMSENSDLDR